MCLRLLLFLPPRYSSGTCHFGQQVLQTRQSDLMEATASEQNAMKQDVKSAQKVSTDGVSGLLESTIVMVTGHAAVSSFFFYATYDEDK